MAVRLGGKSDVNQPFPVVRWWRLASELSHIWIPAINIAQLHRSHQKTESETVGAPMPIVLGLG